MNGWDWENDWGGAYDWKDCFNGWEGAVNAWLGGVTVMVGLNVCVGGVTVRGWGEANAVKGYNVWFWEPDPCV